MKSDHVTLAYDWRPFDASEYDSITGPIIRRAIKNPGETAFIFISSDEREDHIAVGKLHAYACSWAEHILDLGLKPGDIVILALNHMKELIYAFWGAVYAGAVPAITAYKGPMTAAAAYMNRLREMAVHSDAALLITLPGLTAELQKKLKNTNCRVIDFTGVKPTEETQAVNRPPLSGGSGTDTTYLQYTSGTSGLQKGVRLSHRAILNCIQSIGRLMKLNPKDVLVNWLPLYHDFGLFGGFITPLFWNFPTILLSPFKWLRKPERMLQLTHRFRGTISFLPNSGHHHMVRSIPEKNLEGLNLSSLRYLINGSEPLLYESQEMFLKRFAPYGFRETALSAGYGMAENTLACTLSRVDERSPVDWVSAGKMRTLRKAVPVPAHRQGARPNVSSGVPLENMEIQIVDDKGRQLPERHIGEIKLRSFSLFSGYHRSPGISARALEKGWYYTGDMGYMAEGNLYVCGRKQDLIIVGGHNIHPEDLEAAAGTVPGIREDRSVALGIMDEERGTEKIVLICGLERPVSEEEKINLERELRRCIFSRLEVALGKVHFVRKNWVVRTNNGKIAREANLKKYKKKLALQRDSSSSFAKSKGNGVWDL